MLQQHQLFIQVNGVQIANVNSIEIVVLSETVTVGSFVAATQSCMTSYATDLTYIIATPGIQCVYYVSNKQYLGSQQQSKIIK